MKSFGSWLRVRKTVKAEWESMNPVLKKGEFGVQTDDATTEYVKMGDGLTKWNDLPWWGSAPSA